MTVRAILALVAAGGAWLFGRWRARGRVDAEVWPWMLAEIEMAVGHGRAPSVALLGVALHGPPGLRAAAGRARDVWRATGDPPAGISALQGAMADPWLDRICRTVEAVEALDGDAAAALARLRTAAVADAVRKRQRSRCLRSLQLAAWVALAPVMAAATGHLGAAAAAVAVTAAVGAWSGWLIALPARGARVLPQRS